MYLCVFGLCVWMCVLWVFVCVYIRVNGAKKWCRMDAPSKGKYFLQTVSYNYKKNIVARKLKVQLILSDFHGACCYLASCIVYLAYLLYLMFRSKTLNILCLNHRIFDLLKQVSYISNAAT